MPLWQLIHVMFIDHISDLRGNFFHNFHILLSSTIYFSEWHWVVGLLGSFKNANSWQTKVPKRWVFPTHHSNLCDLASIATSSKGRAHCRSPEPVRRCRFLLRAVKSCTKKSRWVDGFFHETRLTPFADPQFCVHWIDFWLNCAVEKTVITSLQPILEACPRALFEKHKKSLESKHEIFSVKKYGNLETFCHHQTNNLAKNTTH